MKMMQPQNYQVPNREYLELHFVNKIDKNGKIQDATGKGNNAEITMENLHDGTFKFIKGRVSIRVGKNKPVVYIHNMDEWDNMVISKQMEGYMITKTSKMDKVEVTKTGDYKVLDDAQTQAAIEKIMSYANKAFQSNYSISVDDISDDMLNMAKSILDRLSKEIDTISLAEFNQSLTNLFAIIPRRIDNISKILPISKNELRDTLAAEQDLYGLILSQLRTSKSMILPEKTILEAMNLTWRPVTPEEEAHLKKMMKGNVHQYVQAWRIENNATRERYNQFLAKHDIAADGQHELFHGSRSENFWSIITNGLTINPTGVIVTGKMFGNGTYFADDADKSMGYTSYMGSRWANGTSNVGLLAVYDVITGKQYHPHGSDCSLTARVLEQKCPGANCTWARKADTGLRKDEIIVYNDSQSSIKYLIEFAH